MIYGTALSINQTPVLAAVSNITVNVGIPLTFAIAASDADVPSQILTYSLLHAPVSATLNTTNGVFFWRPRVAEANSTNLIAMVVTDNGSPNLSATQSFAVVVNKLSVPKADGAELTGGQFQLTISGDAGPDYLIQVSSNLTDWITLQTNNAPVLPFQWTDGDSTNFPQRFYRVLLGP